MAGIPIGQWSGRTLPTPCTRASSDIRLSSRQTRQMIRLTWALTVLTVVMAFGLAVQIYLAVYPPH